MQDWVLFRLRIFYKVQVNCFPTKNYKIIYRLLLRLEAAQLGSLKDSPEIGRYIFLLIGLYIRFSNLVATLICLIFPITCWKNLVKLPRWRAQLGDGRNTQVHKRNHFDLDFCCWVCNTMAKIVIFFPNIMLSSFQIKCWYLLSIVIVWCNWIISYWFTVKLRAETRVTIQKIRNQKFCILKSRLLTCHNFFMANTFLFVEIEYWKFFASLWWRILWNLTKFQLIQTTFTHFRACY